MKNIVTYPWRYLQYLQATSGSPEGRMASITIITSPTEEKEAV